MTKLRLSVWTFAIVCAPFIIAARGATQGADQHDNTIASVLDHRLASIEKRVVDAADAMPADKYTFLPTNGEFKGVNTFGEQVRHIGDDNYGAFGAFLTEKRPGPPAGTSKAELVAYVRGAFAFGHRAVATITAENAVTPLNNDQGLTRRGLTVEEIGHSENHYGQIVEYLRMNGIIPPASRPQPK